MSFNFNFKSINRPDEYKNWDSISKYSKFIAEPKYDGVRMLAEKKDGILTIHRESTNIKNLQFPEVLAQLDDMPDNTIFDGELCILDESPKSYLDELNYLPLVADFSKMQKRITLKNETKIKLLSERTPAKFIAFDCPTFKGIDIRTKPLTERRQKIEEWSSEFSPAWFKPEELISMIEKFNMEGLVVKDPNAQYGKTWHKFKNYVENDYVVIGINSLDHNISSLELAKIGTTESIGSVNWQFYEPENQTDLVKKSLIGKVVNVRHMITSKGKLRFPSLQKKDKILKVIAV